MEHIKIYENFNQPTLEAKIKEFCRKYKVYNPRIVDGIINIGDVGVYNEDVDLQNSELDKFPYKFGRIQNNFFCGFNNLITLENSPDWIGGEFGCDFNNLTTLRGGPKYVGSAYYCNNNKLVDLYGFPQFFKGAVWCNNNPVHEIISLYSQPNDGKLSVDVLQQRVVKFIKFLNEYEVIRNHEGEKPIVIESRLMDALYEIGIQKLDESKLQFKSYRVI